MSVFACHDYGRVGDGAEGTDTVGAEPSKSAGQACASHVLGAVAVDDPTVVRVRDRTRAHEDLVVALGLGQGRFRRVFGSDDDDG